MLNAYNKVVAALIKCPEYLKTVSDLVTATGLSRGDVVSTIAALASDGRVTRAIANEVDGALIVRWMLKR